MSTQEGWGEYAIGMLTLRGAFLIGASGAVGEFADGNTNLVQSVVRDSEGVYTVTLNTQVAAFPYMPVQILTPLCGVSIEDITPTAAEDVEVKYVKGSWSQTTRSFKLVTIGLDDNLVEDPDQTATVWFCFTGPVGPTGVDKLASGALFSL